MKVERYIEKNDLGIVLKNRCFKDVTTMKVGGKIKNLYYPNSLENLLDVINYLNTNNKKFLMLGNGSNIVASDRKFNRLVISGKHLENDYKLKDDYFIVSAFSDLRKVNARLLQDKISTFINLSGIPATVGGAIVMNAGAFKGNISDNLLWVECIVDGKVIKIDKKDLNFSYRNSIFKNKNYIIINAAFSIIYDNNCMLKYHEIMSKRKEIHPLDYPNSGSIFKNLETIKAYKIINDINLVGYEIGGATFSEKHSNFIINKNNAKAKDVYNLIILAKKRAFVYENVILEEEIILLNFFSYSFFKYIVRNKT